MRNRKKAVVLMTALVPTVGHGALIRFANELVGPGGFVDVYVSGRSFEPVSLFERELALQEFADKIEDSYISVCSHDDDDAPQNPSTPEEWDYWKDMVSGNGFIEYDYFVASEPYGKKMAELIGAEFVPFDMDRWMLPVKGSDVREDIWLNFDLVLPEFQPYLHKRVTIFGQESTGKTTLANDLRSWGSVIPEFARPYLEARDDITITDEVMAMVVRGQYALQQTASRVGEAITIQDTDLLSTIGYYRIYGGNPAGTDIEAKFRETKADLYIVTPDNIPFVPDPLRYGGDVREGTMQFWIDLLKEYDCNYVVLESSDGTGRYDEAADHIERHLEKWYAPIRDFIRE